MTVATLRSLPVLADETGTQGSNVCQPSLEDRVLKCNEDGMEYIRKGSYKNAFEQLKYAEGLLDSNLATLHENHHLYFVTCNNLGCYYKVAGKFHAALSYLRKALNFQTSDDALLAGTHLNMCSCFSKLERHEKAVFHALKALDLASQCILVKGASASSEDYSFIAIAYHNIAMERESLKEVHLADAAYKEGYRVAKKWLGDRHPLTVALAVSITAQHGNCSRGPVLDSTGVAEDTSPVFSRLPAGKCKNGSTMPAAPWLPVNMPVVSTQADHWNPLMPALPANDLPQFRETFPQLSGGKCETQLAASTWCGAIPRPHTNAVETRGHLYPGFEEEFSHPLAYHSQKQHPITHQHAQFTQSAGPFFPAIPGAVVEVHRGSCSPPPPFVFTTDPRPQTGKQPLVSAFVTRKEPVAPQGRRKVNEVQRENKSPTRPVAGLKECRERNAALCIQKGWRMRSKRQISDHGDHDAATKIQARWRSFQVTRRIQNAAAVAIQKWARGCIVRRARLRKRAVGTLQKMFRGYRVRSICHAERGAASCIARVILARLIRRRRKREALRREKAAIAIQTAERRRVAKEVLRRKRKIASRAARVAAMPLKIQRAYRGFLARQECNKRRTSCQRRKVMNCAAVTVQTGWRTHAARKHAQAIRVLRRVEKVEAATVIQKFRRRFTVRRNYLNLRREHLNHLDSIVTIQRHMRGYLGRFQTWRAATQAELRQWAAIEIQRCWRGFSGRLRFMLEFNAVRRREVAARTLQRAVRGWLARSRAKRMRKIKTRAAFEIARRRFKAAQHIQSRVRGIQTRAFLKETVFLKATAAMKIQCVFRGYRMRKQMWERFRIVAATHIQAVARSYFVRKQLRSYSGLEMPVREF